MCTLCHKGSNNSCGTLWDSICREFSLWFVSVLHRDISSLNPQKTKSQWNFSVSERGKRRKAPKVRECEVCIGECVLAQWKGVFSPFHEESILNSLPHLLLLANSCGDLESCFIISHEKAVDNGR